MFTHPTITQALPEQHRPRPVTRALRATLAAAALAGAAFMVTPSGPAGAASSLVHWKAVTHHYVGNSSHRAILAVHRSDIRFGAGHVSGGVDHASGQRWA